MVRVCAEIWPWPKITTPVTCTYHWCAIVTKPNFLCFYALTGRRDRQTDKREGKQCVMTPVMEGFYNSRHSDSDTHFVMTRCAVTALRFVAPAYCQVTGANRARVCGPGDYAVMLSLLLQQTVVITTLRFVSCPLQQKVYNHDTLWCLHCIP